MKTLFLILLGLLVSLSSATSLDFTETDQKIMDYTFNAEFGKADSLLEQQIKLRPDHPKYYALKSHVLFYTRYFDNSGLPRDSLLQLVFEYAGKAIEVSEDLEEDTELKFYLGVAHGFKSRVLGIQRNLWDAYWEVRKSNNYLEDVIEAHPDFADAYLNIAVLEYFNATRITGWRGALAWMVGMSGDREKAIAFFNKVEKNGILFQPEAKFINIMMHRFFEPDIDLAISSAQNFLNEYPQNNFIRNQLLNAQLNQIIRQKGTGYLAANIEAIVAEYNITNPNVLNGIGYGFINEEDYENALAVLKINLDLYPEVANSYDSLGEVYMLMGNNNAAIEHYKIARSKLDSDTTITENFRNRLREGIEERLSELTPS